MQQTRVVCQQIVPGTRSETTGPEITSFGSPFARQCPRLADLYGFPKYLLSLEIRWPQIGLRAVITFNQTFIFCRNESV